MTVLGNAGVRPAGSPPGDPRARLVGIGLIAITGILWGTTGTAATFAPEAGPLAIAAGSLGVGGLLQALVAIPALWAAAPALRAQAPTVLLGAAAVGVYPLAFYSSMHVAGVAVGTVVALSSAPLAAGVLELVVDGRPLGRWWVVAAGMGVLGSALLCLSRVPGPARGTGVASVSPSSTPGGGAVGLVARIMYAAYTWAAGRLMARGIGRAASMGAVFGGGGILLMPVLALTGAPLVASREGFLVAAYLALVPMFGGYLLFGIGLARVSASTATTITLLEPAVAAILAVAVVGERLSPVGWAGLGILASALLVLTLAPDRLRPG